VPALIYFALNAGGDGARGWGIPMATDIAFALGVLTLLGPRVPSSLKAFLLALAIADDIGAIAVIAIFYSEGVDPSWLALAGAALASAVLLGLAGVRNLVPYLAVSLVCWGATYQAGIHPTIAGVASAFVLPAVTHAHGAVPDDARLIERAEHVLHPWTSMLIVPLFALANAGVDVGGEMLRDAATAPITAGVALGLAAGKPVGIVAFTAAAVALRLGTLPEGVSWRQIAGAGMVAGIGFTVSLFVAELAFDEAARVDEAKVGILAASAVAAAIGAAVLAWGRAGAEPQMDTEKHR
jgi:NhaA family Na+:H+ antiporter